jgi:type IV pilus assembly protein PilE
MPSDMLNAAPEPSDGFTLIELMIIVVVLAILSAITIPNYSRYVARSQLGEATNALAHYHVRMEQYFRLQRSYANGGQCGVAPPANLVNFTVTCGLEGGGNAYMATAIGIGETSGFAYTINQANVRATASVPAHWGNLPVDAGSRWVTR